MELESLPKEVRKIVWYGVCGLVRSVVVAADLEKQQVRAVLKTSLQPGSINEPLNDAYVNVAILWRLLYMFCAQNHGIRKKNQRH